MPAARIVPTGPESFVDEILRIDRDFFGCCEDCRRGDEHHPIDEGEGDDEPAHLAPVLVRL